MPRLAYSLVVNFLALKIQHGSLELQPETLVYILGVSTSVSDCDQEISEDGSDLSDPFIPTPLSQTLQFNQILHPKPLSSTTLVSPIPKTPNALNHQLQKS